MRFNFIALQNLVWNLFVLRGTVAECAPSFPASLSFPDDHNSCGWNTLLEDTSSSHAEGALRTSFFWFKFPTHIFPICLLIQSDNFSIPCPPPVRLSSCSLIMTIQEKNPCKIGTVRSMGVGERSTGRRGTAICSALALLGKAWVRLMKLDLTQTSFSLHVPPFLSALFSVYLSF